MLRKLQSEQATTYGRVVIHNIIFKYNLYKIRLDFQFKTSALSCGVDEQEEVYVKRHPESFLVASIIHA